jgi:hypothetical protein
VTDGLEVLSAAKVVLVASFTYENVRLLAAVQVESDPQRRVEQPRQVGRHYFSHHQAPPVTALFPSILRSWYGLPAQGVGRGQLGRRQLRITRSLGFHRRRQFVGDVRSAPDHGRGE